MKMENNINYVHRNIKLYGLNNTNIIDATCGNGNDTLYLSTLFPKANIYSFDIQSIAIESAKIKCRENNNIQFILDSHENINKYVNDNLSLVVFNLGYLPRGNSKITTIASSTIKALNVAMNLLNNGGAIVITLYRGDENIEETVKVLDFLEKINKDFYIVSKYDLINLNNNPFNIVIEKK